MTSHTSNNLYNTSVVSSNSLGQLVIQPSRQTAHFSHSELVCDELVM